MFGAQKSKKSRRKLRCSTRVKGVVAVPQKFQAIGF